jgi:hypothetical protein
MALAAGNELALQQKAEEAIKRLEKKSN